MPDDQDYAHLSWLLASAEEWTADDAETARTMLRQQHRAVAASDARDRRRREAMTALAEQLADAIRRYEARIT